MKKTPRKSPTEEPLLFTIDPEPAKESLTSYGGIPLVVKAFRALGVGESVNRNVKVKERERGFDEATLVESFVMGSRTFIPIGMSVFLRFHSRTHLRH